ncbi:dynein-related subfamily AAA family protein [Aquimarina sp. MAR_2010_214]|uniref:DNA repair ATPase n=1 Tax=Aquimarina sp. MAR_2010_214 TaxID=1250026 RepID=UPI000C70B7F7|nr:DNA repair ATPase [Aquimarina sp. MAR_2010_214]PKV49384.1 dynein-related subfamily AAA family protein [Aquimarina sp. MAR_2010_214]
MEEIKKEKDIQLDGGTYEIIQKRLQKQKGELQNRLTQLNEARKEVFGSVETKLIANNRISTEHNCIARDIITIGDFCLFGYNVHFGLRTEITLEDVFSIYTYKNDHFAAKSLDLINDSIFIDDFTNLYKYYRNTIFSKFAINGNYLHMVFQLSESVSDIKTFKWLINEDTLSYIDNRSEHEFKFPKQHEFNWTEVTRDMHRYGAHPHISILDKVFVETIGGDLTIKIEDNTDEGKGILDEIVEHVDQTLDDGQYRFADLGNLIVLEIKPFQETPRYFVYNHKMQEVKKISCIKDACILLPDDQGIIYPNGYYLQSGDFKLFTNEVNNIKFQEKITSPNGEDFLYIFYQANKGLYTLMAYNVIEQEVKTPIVCNGFTILEHGELCYFKTENEQTKHHVIQIWQTPFIKGDVLPSEHIDTLLYKIGNKDIVKAMAESNALITLLNKEDNYDGLYDDIAKFSNDIIDSYYWIREEDTFRLDIPLEEINGAANSAIDEFEKVVQLRKTAANITKETLTKAEAIFGKIKSSSFRSIDDFVEVLSQLRTLRGEVIGLNDIRYVDNTFTEELETKIAEQTEKISQRSVQFLLDDKALLPYHTRVEEKQVLLEKIKKVIDAKKLEQEVNQIATDLEMLIDIVSNLQIEDTSHSTKIIDTISLIFATINQLKSGIKNKIKSLGSKEATAEFAAQLKLVDQSIINYLDIANTPEKTDELLNKVSVQLEDLEGRFADFEEFITQIIEKREEVYNAFETRKNSLIEAQNKKTIALENAANRILKGVTKKALSFDSVIDINGYFASDLMINKLRDIVTQLQKLDDAGKAESIETAIKVAKEDATRKLKDKQDLYEDGENIIKLGKHKFGVNKQPLDLTIVYKDGSLNYHLTGTDFYQEIINETLLESKKYWDQELISENQEVYRASYLAFKIFKHYTHSTKDSIKSDLKSLSDDELLELVKSESSKNYAEGYVKGVHDIDAFKILKVLTTKDHDLGVLRFDPNTRAFAQYFWYSLESKNQKKWNDIIKASGEVLDIFPESNEYHKVITNLEKEIINSFSNALIETEGYSEDTTNEIANYLFIELQKDHTFCTSQTANELHDAFIKALKKKKGFAKLKKSLELDTKSRSNGTIDWNYKINLALQWVSSYLKTNHPLQTKYAHEVVCILLFKDESISEVIHVNPSQIIEGLNGSHNSITENTFEFNYHEFISKMEQFSTVNVPSFGAYREAKHKVTETLKEDLKLTEFEPKVLSSFVRNKLIDQVYLPLFGDNLSKQLGSLGDNKRTDRMGMLLLISPPGYGKTTLMEYMANRLGLVFMKINGPAIGHEVTSVDPMAANNSAAREELKKLNLAFEMGNNVMLYLDDIQHCNPEFLQKFISLSDGTRKIEGVYNGTPKTYDLRSKKFCVIMAGNPYTESGEKFQIPDMLANRADIYNLGDIIGDTANLFKLSLIENSMTSNPILHQLSGKHYEDIYHLIEMAETGSKEGIELQGNHTKQEIQDYLAVLEKVIIIRNTILKVNETYIKSAAMEDAYRVEPSFKLQGSYRDMNKLVAKIVPIMNEKELQTLLLSHYENESQTLTSAAEANLLKYKEMTQSIEKEEVIRWEAMKETFTKNNALKGFGDKNEMAQVLAQMMQFSDHLAGIQEVLKKGLDKK